MSVLRAAIVIGAFLSVSSAAAESSSEAMRSFGLIGTWSVECERDVEQRCSPGHCYGKLIFSAPESGALTVEMLSPTIVAGGSLKTIWQFNSAVRITEDKLKLTRTATAVIPGRLGFLLPTKGEIWETVYVKSGNKVRVWLDQRTDGLKIITQDGFYYAPDDNWKPEDGPVKHWHATEKQVLPIEKCLN